MANKRIPIISHDKIINTELNTSAITKEDRRAKAFIKDKKLPYYTSIRLNDSAGKKLRKLHLVTSKSINSFISLAVEEFLEKKSTQRLLEKCSIDD